MATNYSLDINHKEPFSLSLTLQIIFDGVNIQKCDKQKHFMKPNGSSLIDFYMN